MSNGFAHIELNTDDPAKAQKFYKAVFPSWKFSAVPGAAYWMIDAGTKGVGAGGGLAKAPTEAHWLAYVEVDDVKKTIEKARKAGARIMMEFHDIGDMGTIGIFLDPSGARIGVWAKHKTAPKKKAAKKAAPKKAAPKKAAKKR